MSSDSTCEMQAWKTSYHPALARQAQAPNTCRRTSAGGQAGAAALVYTQELLPSAIHAGSQAPKVLETYDPETGEVLEFDLPLKPGFNHPRYTKLDHQNARNERWLSKWALDDLLPGSRQQKCHRWRVPQKDLEVKLSNEHQKAFFAGFECCGSVWACPLCAPKITERRRAEIQEAIDRSKQMGLSVMLGTFTIPHGMGDDVKDILSRMKRAWAKTSSTRRGVEVRALCGVQGTIRVLEVTYGPNGWHPHFHVLFFLDTNLTPEIVESAWYMLWLDACRKSGLGDPSPEHGVRFDDGSGAARYVSKWGLDQEMTKGHLKRGKTSINPFDLIRYKAGLVSPDLQAVFDSLGINQDKAGSLFVVYLKAFKGSRQLYWSNGLRDLLGIQKEETDKELAEKEMDKDAALIATLTDGQRFALIRKKKLPWLLCMAEDDPEGIPAWLDDLTRGVAAQRSQVKHFVKQ